MNARKHATNTNQYDEAKAPNSNTKMHKIHQMNRPVVFGLDVLDHGRKHHEHQILEVRDQGRAAQIEIVKHAIHISNNITYL